VTIVADNGYNGILYDVESPISATIIAENGDNGDSPKSAPFSETIIAADFGD